MIGKIILTIISAGRRHDPARTPEDPKVTALRESRCLNPHPEQVTDEAFLADGFFDARDAVQVKYEMVRRVSVDGAPVTATAAAFGYSRPSYYQAAAALAESGLDGLVPARPGPRGGHKLTGQILAWAEAQLAADPALKPAAAGRAHRRGVRGARAPPLGRACAGPPPGALQKPLTCPPPSAGRRRTRPCPCDHHLAPRLLNQARPPGPDAGQAHAPGGGLDARYEQLRHAVLHARADRVPARPRRAHRQGRHRLAARPGPPDLRSRHRHRARAVTGGPRRPGRRPGPVATELVHALAGLAVALAGT